MIRAVEGLIGLGTCLCIIGLIGWVMSGRVTPTRPAPTRLVPLTPTLLSVTVTDYMEGRIGTWEFIMRAEDLIAAGVADDQARPQLRRPVPRDSMGRPFAIGGLPPVHVPPPPKPGDAARSALPPARPLTNARDARQRFREVMEELQHLEELFGLGRMPPEVEKHWNTLCVSADRLRAELEWRETIQRALVPPVMFRPESDPMPSPFEGMRTDRELR